MKNLIILLSIFTILVHTGYSQDCTQSDYTLQSQSEIDNFGTNYPNCTAIEGSLTIKGEDIVNINGLSQIQSVGGTLRIQNTSLTNLQGLNNLTSLGHSLSIFKNPDLVQISALQNLVSIGYNLSVSNNNSLTSIEGLQNIDLSSPLTRVFIKNCPVLETCQIDNLCEYLGNYGQYSISNNGENCKNREAVVAACALPFDSSPRVQLLFDGFEDWTASNVPVNWESELQESGGIPNIEQVPSLIEGDYAVLLRSNIPYWEGYCDTPIRLDIEGENAIIDISFTYKCLGTGYCLVNLGQGVLGSEGVNYRNIWNSKAGDSTQYTVVLQNIEVNAPFDFFKFVQLEATPIHAPTGQFGISEFIIDDFLVTRKETSSSNTSIINENLKIYPNPASTQLLLETEYEYDEIVIYDNLGQQVNRVKFTKELNISQLSNGIYFLRLEKGDKSAVQRFVKM